MCTGGGRGDRSGLEVARTFVERVEWPPGAADVWVQSPVAIAPHTSAGISLLADGTAAANFIRRRHNLVALSVVGGVKCVVCEVGAACVL